MIRRPVDFPGWESFARISYSICQGLVRDNVCRTRRSGYEDGREARDDVTSRRDWKLGDVSSGSKNSLLESYTRQQSFASLNT